MIRTPPCRLFGGVVNARTDMIFARSFRGNTKTNVEVDLVARTCHQIYQLGLLGQIKEQDLGSFSLAKRQRAASFNGEAVAFRQRNAIHV